MRTTVIRSAGVLAAIGFALNARAGDDTLRFNRDIRPILAETCYRCHGPGVKKAGLRLDQPGAALKETESGAIPIVPGNPDESELVRRIFAEDETEVMPPPSAKKPLTPDQKERLKRWVEQGAPYEGHWAFTAPVKEPVPSLRAVRGRTANPIDAFLTDRLRREGLSMSPEADKETLIRRVAFALTGLPPTPKEVDAFLGDTSSRAYENLVERLLFSPRFGEEMARHWLDVARYGDTHGMHLDNERQNWLYRDWVVRAFNDNMPFDRFTVDQLAGDLVPDATPEDVVGTAFVRSGVTTGEGGSIEAEWYYRYAVERTSTAAETWMGLTAGCAVCHDHKFDPLSTKEFYSLYAFFYSAAGPALDGNIALHEPVLRLPTEAQKPALEAVDARLAEIKTSIERRHKELDYRDPADAADELAAGDADDGIESEPVAAGKEKGNKAADDPARSFRAWLKRGAIPPKTAANNVRQLFIEARTKKPDADVERTLRRYYLEAVCTTTRGSFQPLEKALAKATKERADLEASVPATPIFRDADKPRQAFVMIRGQYDKPGEKVEPGTPAILPPLKRAKADRATRLDLANWLLLPEHPLTARVTVNRFWQQFFGTGLVKTSFDFGTQGDVPSHPELLDWLAVSFREGGWDVKALVRMMVTSSAFRQSSRVTPELLRRDPENRLLARGPRFRLDAEQIRDNALYVSGLIDLTMGGRGVRPYQPPNIWEPVAYSGSNTRSYVQDVGSALYRRSVYTFLKKTAPPPFMANFDAPSREDFCTRRERSNTPLQALQLMNDVQHVEAARALAGRMLAEGGATPADRIAFAFRTVLARAPEPDELAILRGQLGQHLARYVRDPEAARQAVHVGESPPGSAASEIELAAYTLVANTLLNLDETVTRN